MATGGTVICNPLFHGAAGDGCADARNSAGRRRCTGRHGDEYRRPAGQCAAARGIDGVHGTQRCARSWRARQGAVANQVTMLVV
jgi:hypothetical protein